MKIDQQIESLYKEVGVQCPFALASHLELKVTHRDDLGDVYGLYTKTTATKTRIYINSSIGLDTQEDVCYLMIRHHVISPELEKCLSRADVETWIEEQSSKPIFELNALSKRRVIQSFLRRSLMA